MRVAYFAEDGREFDSEAECRKYERRLSDLLFELQHGIHAYDDEGYAINFDNCEVDWLEERFQDIVYITFDNKKAIEVFLAQARDFGINEIDCDIKRELVVSERYFYDWDHDEWTCLEDKQKELDKIAAIFKK